MSHNSLVEQNPINGDGDAAAASGHVNSYRDDIEQPIIEEAQPKPTPAKKKRMISLDILRGATVMLMIIVNNQPGK